MDYDEEVDRAFGNIPEFGAIFISNIHTKKECMKRRMFALPSSRAEFVKHIKGGMVLFLFEFRKRQLFGVYQASSDGAMDILPHAFNYSGRRFPAQVRFRQIWNCDPLSEKEFRDAIRENYFSASHFNFGLSKDQVRRLLYLFSSKKIQSEIPLNPRSEAIVEVDVKGRRWVGGSRCERSERGYMEADEYEEIDTLPFSDRHVSSLAKGKGGDVLIDGRVYAEGKGYPFPQDEFLAKKRRTGKESSLTTNNVAENGLYSHGYRRTSCTDAPKDSLDEVIGSANSRRLLAAQMVSENQVDTSHYHVQSSDHFVDQLDVRARDDYTVMQRCTLPDDYNMHNYHKAFASDHYGDSMGRGTHVLSDDYVKRDCNVALKSMANGSNDSLNLFKQGHELMNKKLGNRHYLDCDGSSTSAFDPSASLLHKIRKISAAGRSQIDESEPDFRTCSAEGFSSRNFSHPLQYGYGNNEHRNFPIVEGSSTENMVKEFPPTHFATAKYIANKDRQNIDGRIRESGRIPNLEVSHTHTNPAMSKKYPFSQQDQNLSSFSDKFCTEKHLSQHSLSRNFDLPHTTFDDATITRDASCLPDHANSSYECSAPMEANWKSTSMQKTQPHGGSLGDIYPPSSNRPQQYTLESEKFSNLQDRALEFESIGFSRSTSSLQTSLPQESVNSLAKPNPYMDMDLNASGPVNYNGSLSSRLSLPRTDLEDFETNQLFSSYPKSMDAHFPFHENHPEASEHLNQHVPLHGMAKLVGEEFSYSEPEDLGVDICLPETDLAIYENQRFRFSGNMNLKELHNTTQTNSSLNRRSVFTRLSSNVTPRLGRGRNVIDVNHQDSYMDATADEVMEMLQQDDDLSPRKFRKSRIAGQPRESAVIRKRTQCNMETDHSKMENKKLKGVILTTADGVNEILKETRTSDFKHHSAVDENKTQCYMETDHSTSHTIGDGMDEIQKETRTLDFKRRSDRKKNAVGIAAGAAPLSKPTGGNEQVKSSMSTALRRKKLVRPVFSSTDTDMNAKHGNEKILIPAPTLEKDDITGSSNVLASETCQEMDLSKELRHPEEQKDDVAHVVPSTNVDLKGRERANDDLHIGSSMVLKEAYRQKSLHSQTLVEGVLVDGTDNIIKETSQQKISDIQTSVEFVIKETSQLKSLDIQTSAGGVLAKDADITIKGTSQLKSLDTQSSVGGVLTNFTDTDIKETSQLKRLDIQTSVEGVSAKDADTTIKETSQSESLDIQTSVGGVLANATNTAITETSQPKSLDIQTSAGGVLAEDPDTTVKGRSQSKSLDIQTPVGDVLAEVTDTTINETSHQKSLDVPTSFEGILAKDTDTTITGLNLPESSLEGFKFNLGAGFENNSLDEGKHLEKMKIILTTKKM